MHEVVVPGILRHFQTLALCALLVSFVHSVIKLSQLFHKRSQIFVNPRIMQIFLLRFRIKRWLCFYRLKPPSLFNYTLVGSNSTTWSDTDSAEEINRFSFNYKSSVSLSVSIMPILVSVPLSPSNLPVSVDASFMRLKWENGSPASSYTSISLRK